VPQGRVHSPVHTGNSPIVVLVTVMEEEGELVTSNVSSIDEKAAA
jgi:hypothetical protein